MGSNRIITFEPQPEFPVEDISARNAMMAEHCLATSSDSQAYYDTYISTLRVLHHVGNSALIAAEISPNDNRGEYQAFCHGFTNIDYLATLLGSRQHVQFMSGAGMQHFFINPGEMADFELWQRRHNWLLTHQKTIDVIRTTSDRIGETPKELAARMLGAQVASEIMYAAA